MYNQNYGIVNADGTQYIPSWTPAVIEETYYGKREINLQTQHFSDGKLFLLGEINENLTNNFTIEMLYLIDKGEPIDIYINSPGGSVNAGLVLYDLIQSCVDKIDINMYCVGTAASMAAVILAGGQQGRRYILPHSKVMIHEPLIAGGMGGSATTIKKTADSIIETKNITNGLLAKHTGKRISTINKETAYDHYMNADEAVKFGICDQVCYPI